MNENLSQSVAVTIGRNGELECLGCGLELEVESVRFYEPIAFEKHLLKHRRMGHSVNRSLFERAKRWRSNLMPQSEIGGQD
jgi:hypothetical protein